ncbi:UDP-N-acetylmuramoyl-tripeptide--D-alanyl-D-alanine ligase [Paenibacillus marinisediminis]
MIEANLQWIASVTGGSLQHEEDNDIIVKGVCRDSRSIQPGSLYVPLCGERFDGHDYVEQAIQDGAAVALWQADKPLPEARLPLVVVPNTLKALQDLAQAHLAQRQVKVVAVTGSNGKTTTKDLIASVLGQAYVVHKTNGNFNNHIGLPLTVLSMPAESNLIVLEMGMSGRGEIHELSMIAKPDIAVITNAGEAHLLQLGSREEIARAKMEIISGLKEGGVLVSEGDNPLLRQAFNEQETLKPARMEIITFGMDTSNDYKPDGIMQLEDGMSFSITSPKVGTSMFTVPLLGQHNVMNALAAVAVGRLLRVPDPMIAAGLRDASITGSRSEKIVTDEGWTLLNDTYNASPSAMKAALTVLASMRSGKRIAVLGDMLELGEQEVELHREVGRTLTPDNVDVLLTYGRLGEEIANGAREHMADDRIRSYQDKQQLRQALLQLVKPHDAVLVKASFGTNLEEIIKDWITTIH